MHYKPDAAQAFASVEYIMRDVSFGWLIRYMHSTGASFFFIVVYLHMFRGMLYGSYKKQNNMNFTKISCRDIPLEGPTISISKHHIGPKLEKWLSSINFINKLKVGSAIKFTLIAEGKADIFPRTISLET